MAPYPSVAPESWGCPDTTDESASAGVIDAIDVIGKSLFCPAADQARGIVGLRGSYLLKRRCNNLQKFWVPGRNTKQKQTHKTNTTQQTKTTKVPTGYVKSMNPTRSKPLLSALLDNEIALYLPLTHKYPQYAPKVLVHPDDTPAAARVQMLFNCHRGYWA